MAANAGVVRAFREVLGLRDGELIIPEYHASMGALGAVFHLLDHPPAQDGSFRGLAGLEKHLANPVSDLPHWEPLERPCAKGHKDVVFRPDPGKTLDVFLGIDVGSLSTNVVLIDEDNNVVARRYLPTASRPLEAIRRGLAEIHAEVGEHVVVKAVGTTGSGRYLTGDFVGADAIKNEITAQATAAMFYHPEVDTVFEIGGQDSKYISIERGVIVDFEMNKVCAAGTGSFLEEQAEKLGIRIVDEFGDLALSAQAPSRLGDRCTVFMESDLNAHQQKGADKEDLVGGLAYSIVLNYIQKVVGAKRIGEQHPLPGRGGQQPGGGGGLREGDRQADHRAAPLRRDGRDRGGDAGAPADPGKRRPTRFKGFQVSKAPYALEPVHLPGVREPVRDAQGEDRGRGASAVLRRTAATATSRRGAREKERRRAEIPNLVQLREKLLLGDYQEEPLEAAGRPTIGIPRGLMAFYQQFPYWRAFFEELGFRVVLSRPTDRPLVTQSLSMLVAETCFPVEVMHGHVHDLLAKNPDYIFMPFVVDNAGGERTTRPSTTTARGSRPIPS